MFYRMLRAARAGLSSATFAAVALALAPGYVGAQDKPSEESKISEGAGLASSILSNAENAKLVVGLVERHASAELRDYLRRNADVAVLVTIQTGRAQGGISCFAMTGLTHSPTKGKSIRMPSEIWHGGGRATAVTDEAVDRCVEDALTASVKAFAEQPLSAQTKDIDKTIGSGGSRAAGAASPGTISSWGFGLSQAGRSRLINAVPGWVPRAYDHRHYTLQYVAAISPLKDGGALCAVSLTFTQKAPDGRNPFVVPLPGRILWYLDPKEANDEKEIEDCINQQLTILAKSVAGDGSEAGTKKTLDRLTAVGLEPGVPAPDAKAIGLAIKKWQQEQAQADAARARKERTNAANNGSCRPTTTSVSCSSQCVNGDCVLTYPNGCRMRVQVQPRFNGFTNQWEHPAPSC